MGREQVQFNFICRLSWSISSNFGENSNLKCTSQPKIAKNSLKTHILGVQGRSKSSMSVGTPGKLVSSACYDKQQVCVYLQPFSR